MFIYIRDTQDKHQHTNYIQYKLTHTQGTLTCKQTHTHTDRLSQITQLTPINTLNQRTANNTTPNYNIVNYTLHWPIDMCVAHDNSMPWHHSKGGPWLEMLDSREETSSSPPHESVSLLHVAVMLLYPEITVVVLLNLTSPSPPPPPPQLPSPRAVHTRPATATAPLYHRLTFFILGQLLFLQTSSLLCV